MSNRHVREKRKPSQRARGLVVQIVAAMAIVLLCVFVVTGRLLPRFAPGRQVTAPGDILDSRIAAVGTGESAYGGSILYRIETRVRYAANGAPRDQWMPASDVTSDRTGLQLQLLDAKTCLVTWSPHHEENPRCNLQTASK